MQALKLKYTKRGTQTNFVSKRNGIRLTDEALKWNSKETNCLIPATCRVCDLTKWLTSLGLSFPIGLRERMQRTSLLSTLRSMDEKN